MFFTTTEKEHHKIITFRGHPIFNVVVDTLIHESKCQQKSLKYKRTMLNKSKKPRIYDTKKCYFNTTEIGLHKLLVFVAAKFSMFSWIL